MTGTCATPAAEIAERVRSGDLSPVEVVDAYLDRIERIDDEINAYTAVFAEEARAQARAAERAVDAGEVVGPLHGVPVAIKDLGYRIGGKTVSSGAVFPDGPAADSDEPVLARLKDAGAIILGQTNTPEFGHKGVTDNLRFGPTSTPFAPGRNAGGSSGGSAAAVAAGLAAVGMGTDGGGSIRIPASASGTYGMKPSFGRIPREIRPNGFSHHTPFIDLGPLTRTVKDAALVLEVATGSHPRDPFSLPGDGPEYLAATEEPIDGLEVGFSPDFGGFPVTGPVERIVADAVDAFTDAGATVERVDVGLPDHSRLTELWLDYTGAAYATIAETMERQDGIDLLGDHRGSLPAGFVSLVERGRALSAVEYRRGDLLRTAVVDVLADCFAEFDLLVTPTLAVPPVENAADGETVGPSAVDGEPVDPRIGWCLTHPVNFTGHPAASLPAGFLDDELPVGMQVVGPRHDDSTVLAASAAFERERSWQDRYLPI